MKMYRLFGLPRCVGFRRLYCEKFFEIGGLNSKNNPHLFDSIVKNSRSFSITSKDFVDVKVPAFPESVSQAEIRWIKSLGDDVIADEVIGELETDKTTLQILAPCDGTITKLFFNDNDKIAPNDVVCDISASSQFTNTNVTDEVNEEILLKTPAYPESITEGDMRWHKNIGDSVFLDEVIGEIETDKTTIDVVSPCDGVISNLLIQTGDKALVNSKLASITQQNVQSKEITPSKTKVDSTNITPPQVEDKISVKQPPKVIKPISSVIDSMTLTNERETTRVKMTRIRQTISKRLKHAQNTCAMLTTFNEVDMSNLIEMRKTYQDLFVKKHNIKLGFMSAFIKSSCYALQQIPTVNAYIDEDEIVYNNYVDISVAVASPKGLVVPVIRDVQKLDFADIEKILVNYAEESKAGKLKAEDMDGGTFTISNGGVFGSLMGTPIINPPQSAILGMHAINERPVVVNGNIVVRPMMYLALTYDHRLIDGREAVTFLRKIKQTIEDPRTMLLSL